MHHQRSRSKACYFHPLFKKNLPSLCSQMNCLPQKKYGGGAKRNNSLTIVSKRSCDDEMETAGGTRSSIGGGGFSTAQKQFHSTRSAQHPHTGIPNNFDHISSVPLNSLNSFSPSNSATEATSYRNHDYGAVTGSSAPNFRHDPQQMLPSSSLCRANNTVIIEGNSPGQVKKCNDILIQYQSGTIASLPGLSFSNGGRNNHSYYYCNPPGTTTQVQSTISSQESFDRRSFSETRHQYMMAQGSARQPQHYCTNHHSSLSNDPNAVLHTGLLYNTSKNHQQINGGFWHHQQQQHHHVPPASIGTPLGHHPQHHSSCYSTTSSSTTTNASKHLINPSNMIRISEKSSGIPYYANNDMIVASPPQSFHRGRV